MSLTLLYEELLNGNILPRWECPVSSMEPSHKPITKTTANAMGKYMEYFRLRLFMNPDLSGKDRNFVIYNITFKNTELSVNLIYEWTKTEDGRQKMEVRSRETEDRRWKSSDHYFSAPQKWSDDYKIPKMLED